VGFDIGFYDPLSEELDEVERLSNVAGFFATAELVTKLTELLDEHSIPHDLGIEQIRPWLQSFHEYVAMDRPLYEDRFAAYCAHVEAIQRELRAQSEGSGFLLGLDVEKGPEPEEFAPDMRVFLGRAMLNPEPVTPGECQELLEPLRWLAALFSFFRRQFEEREPEVARHIDAVNDIVETLGNYCRRSAEEDRCLRIDF